MGSTSLFLSLRLAYQNFLSRTQLTLPKRPRTVLSRLKRILKAMRRRPRLFLPQLQINYDVDRQNQDSEVQVIDGYFVHFFVPENLETLPKHAISILDVSGSMYGERLQQLKDAMFTVLDDMKPEDFFNIITFSTGVNNWSPSGITNEGDQFAIPATKENKKKAISHVLDLEAAGGTNINSAMLEGLDLAKEVLS